MKIEIKDMRKKDAAKAIQFAIKGMHFDWYSDSKLAHHIYGRYFWYREMNRATQIIAAYIEGKFAGVLLAEMKGEEKKRRSLLRNLYVRLFDLIQNLLFRGGGNLYENTTQEQLEHYLQSNQPDGEILFLAADPDCKIRGIGTALLSALAEREGGKTVYLYTDNACNYLFYEHRGFKRVEEKEIVLDMPKREVPLTCFLYSKKL